MKKTLRERIARLAAMNVPTLREEYRRVFGKDPASSHRQFLFRKISWRLQANEEGWALDKIRELAQRHRPGDHGHQVERPAVFRPDGEEEWPRLTGRPRRFGDRQSDA
jgi:hypothetical protein